MKNLLRVLYYFAGAAIAAISGYLMPLYFLIAFNYSKGIQANEDGFTFIPFGFILIAITVLINVLFVRKAIKMNKGSLYKNLIVIATFVVIVIVTVILTLPTWECFFECLAYFKGLNLAPQR